MIEARGLVKRYGEVQAVDDVTFAVRDRELLVLVGGSGSGKTTLLKLLNRLVEPDAGTILLGGESVLTLPEHLLRRRIGYVFQKIGLFPHLSVAENIGITPSLLGWTSRAIDERVAELMQLLELEPALARRRPAELSGGQQQRVGVARALAARPALVLFDEPFGALDPPTRDRLQQMLLTLRRAVGMTAVLVTHDMAEALLLGDRIGVIERGRLVQLATPREILTRPATPYVAHMMETPRRQARIFEEIVAGDGRA